MAKNVNFKKAYSRFVVIAFVCFDMLCAVAVNARVPRRFDGQARAQYNNVKEMLVNPANGQQPLDSLKMTVQRTLPATGPQRIDVTIYFQTTVDERDWSIGQQPVLAVLKGNWAARQFTREMLFDDTNGEPRMLLDTMANGEEDATHRYFLADGHLVKYYEPEVAYDRQMHPKLSDAELIREFEQIEVLLASALGVVR